MLAGWATPETRGRVYGFHRAMDHLGAVIGPTVASAFLFFYPAHYRTLFALTIIPGAIAVALILYLPAQTPADPAVHPLAGGGAGAVLAGAAMPLPPDFTAFMRCSRCFRSATPPTRFCC